MSNCVHLWLIIALLSFVVIRVNSRQRKNAFLSLSKVFCLYMPAFRHLACRKPDSLRPARLPLHRTFIATAPGEYLSLDTVSDTEISRSRLPQFRNGAKNKYFQHVTRTLFLHSVTEALGTGLRNASSSLESWLNLADPDAAESRIAFWQ